MPNKSCAWCGQDFPSEIKVDSHYRTFNFPLIPPVEPTVYDDLLECNIETLTVMQLCVQTGDEVHYFWVHETCMDPMISAMTALLRLMEKFDLILTSQTFYEKLINSWL